MINTYTMFDHYVYYSMTIKISSLHVFLVPAMTNVGHLMSSPPHDLTLATTIPWRTNVVMYSDSSLYHIVFTAVHFQLIRHTWFYKRNEKCFFTKEQTDIQVKFEVFSCCHLKSMQEVCYFLQ